jgi:hypothetical protein
MVRQVKQIARVDASLGDASPVITQMLKFDRPRLCIFRSLNAKPPRCREGIAGFRRTGRSSILIGCREVCRRYPAQTVDLVALLVRYSLKYGAAPCPRLGLNAHPIP